MLENIGKGSVNNLVDVASRSPRVNRTMSREVEDLLDSISPDTELCGGDAAALGGAAERKAGERVNFTTQEQLNFAVSIRNT
ncbi:hypothetical protein SK128_000621 [Halocaridina rubra]|uniref:Uncharacterized protein n=1 Tax=Halocaridina rubra TaxID=373956 RepID=A0AAN8WUM1_HALRR